MRSWCLAGAALLAATPAWADICAYNSKATANSALFIFEPGESMLTFCAPCGDKTAVPTLVKTKSVAKADPADEESYEVVINGQPIDLAYSYVCRGESSTECANVGKAVQCTDDSDVPDPLPPSAVKR